MTPSWDERLARMIDHTVLKPTTSDDDVRRLCAEVKTYGFAAAVVPPCYVALAVREMAESPIPVCSIVSFPLGSNTPEGKADEASRLLDAGCGEVDMVMNVGAFLSGRHDVVKEEVGRVVTACRGKAILKLIIETAYLDEEAVKLAAGIGAEGGVDFVKTSTGFGPRGASVEDVRLIKSVVQDRAEVKASGGIRTRAFALALVEAGATRIGSSTSLDLISASA